MISCPCEKEVRDLVERGQWPQASPAELRNHAASCRVCADLVLVATAFQRARVSTVAAARPVSPGAIWWRAQLRSRQQAFERIQRPLLGAQVFAFVAVLLPIIGLIAFQAHNLVEWFASLGKASPSAQLHSGDLASASSSASGLIFVVVAAATFALIAGLALYFDAERK